MMPGKMTIYIKADQMVELQHPGISLGDILTVECSQKHVATAIKQLEVLRFPKFKYQRTVVSILKIIEIIHEKYPSAEVMNLGATDIIVVYENQQTPSKVMHIFKAIIVTIISFVGSAYSIMAFSNDVDTLSIFDQLYVLITGAPAQGFNLLQFSYCIGLALGILVFFNHFGHKKLMVDPTPMEIEMRLYEQDIQTTLIQNFERKEKEVDVGNPNTIINHRHQ